MYVDRVMHTELVTVTPDTSLARAREILDQRQIWHLLVINTKNELIGLLSDRDVKKNWASPANTLSTHELGYLLAKLTVETVMVRKIVTITPDTTIERAAWIMQQNRINALPVVENGKPVGIITSTDVMGVLLEAIGIDEEGESTRLVVLVDRDRIGFMAEMSQILKTEQINIRSLFSWPDKAHPGIHHIVIRVPASDGERAVSALKTGGFKAFSGYISDITPYIS